MLLFAGLLSAAATFAEPVGDMPVINFRSSQPATCPAISRYETSGRGKMPKMRKLNELPDADMYRAVYRKIGRCEAPMIVKFGVANQ